MVAPCSSTWLPLPRPNKFGRVPTRILFTAGGSFKGYGFINEPAATGDEVIITLLERFQWIVHLITTAPVLLLAYVGFCLSLSTAIAGTASESAEVNLGRKATHFVSANGSDNGLGTADRPWATINHAAEQAKAGDTVIVRGGRYVLSSQVRVRNSGRSGAWITFIGYPGEKPILDASLIPYSSLVQDGLDNGAFQIEKSAYIRVVNLTVIDSHDAGFTVRDSSNVELINDATTGTFSSGIAVWDTNHSDKATQHIRILGNVIVKATTWDLAPPGVQRRGEPPHEALSVGGAIEFEVAFNHVYNSDKEGISIKETSKQGKVHHNLIQNLDRQGIDVDAYFGELRGIEIYSNVIHDCRGAGVVLSVENVRSVERINIHNNLVFDNDGSGLLFSRFHLNNPRYKIRIVSNVFYHNGYGAPAFGQTYYWITGGLFLDSTNIHDITIKDNIFSDNRGFQIGYSELFLEDLRQWEVVAREKNIKIHDNLIDGRNSIDTPILSGGNSGDRVKIYAANGERAIFADPMFRDPGNEDFRPRRSSFAAATHVTGGTSGSAAASELWWKRRFPPRLVAYPFRRH